MSLSLHLILSPFTTDAVVGISIAILIVLFCVQRFGTEKVGYSFAPIIIIWFTFIGGIGLYNLFKYDVKVLRAFNPIYIVNYFKRNGRKGWISLGGVVLCITGKFHHFVNAKCILAQLINSLINQALRPCLPIWGTSVSELSRYDIILKKKFMYVLIFFFSF